MRSTEQGRLLTPRDAEGLGAAVTRRSQEHPHAVTGRAETDGNKRRQTGPAASHLHASDSELSQGSAHLGGGCEVVFGVGDDLDQQGVVVGGDDSSLEGGRIIQADAHALAAPEHLWGGKGGLRNWVRSQSGCSASPSCQDARGIPALACEVLLHFCRCPQREAGERAQGQRQTQGQREEHIDRGPQGGEQRFGVSGVTAAHT